MLHVACAASTSTPTVAAPRTPASAASPHQPSHPTPSPAAPPSPSSWGTLPGYPHAPVCPCRIPGLLPMWQLCTQMRCPSYLQLHFMALLVKSLSATSKLGLITTCGALTVRVAALCPTPCQLGLPSLTRAAAYDMTPSTPAPAGLVSPSAVGCAGGLQGAGGCCYGGVALSLRTMCPSAVLL